MYIFPYAESLRRIGGKIAVIPERRKIKTVVINVRVGFYEPVFYFMCSDNLISTGTDGKQVFEFEPEEVVPAATFDKVILSIPTHIGMLAPKTTKATCSPEAVSTTWPLSSEMAMVHPRPSRIFS